MTMFFHRLLFSCLHSPAWLALVIILQYHTLTSCRAEAELSPPIGDQPMVGGIDDVWPLFRPPTLSTKPLKTHRPVAPRDVILVQDIWTGTRHSSIILTKKLRYTGRAQYMLRASSSLLIPHSADPVTDAAEHGLWIKLVYDAQARRMRLAVVETDATRGSELPPGPDGTFRDDTPLGSTSRSVYDIFQYDRFGMLKWIVDQMTQPSSNDVALPPSDSSPRSSSSFTSSTSSRPSFQGQGQGQGQGQSLVQSLSQGQIYGQGQGQNQGNGQSQNQGQSQVNGQVNDQVNGQSQRQGNSQGNSHGQTATDTATATSAASTPYMNYSTGMTGPRSDAYVEVSTSNMTAGAWDRSHDSNRIMYEIAMGLIERPSDEMHIAELWKSFEWADRYEPPVRVAVDAFLAKSLDLSTGLIQTLLLPFERGPDGRFAGTKPTPLLDEPRFVDVPDYAASVDLDAAVLFPFD